MWKGGAVSAIASTAEWLHSQIFWLGFTLAMIPLDATGYIATEISTCFLKEVVKTCHLIVWYQQIYPPQYCLPAIRQKS